MLRGIFYVMVKVWQALNIFIIKKERMKKLLIVSPVLVLSLVFMNCSSTRQASASKPSALTYENNLQPVIAQNCAPCHIPSKGGNKKAYDNFANVHADIDEMIRRIELHPGDRGFMPFKRQRLADSTIAIFKQWKEDGRVEK